MAFAPFDAACGDAERILLDTSTLIAFHSPAERAHGLARHLLSRIEADRDQLHGYYSVVSASVLLVRPIRSGQPALTFTHTFLTEFPNLTALPVDLTVASQAAALRATTAIRLPDALIIASGLLAGCEIIASNDEGWKRRCEPLFPPFRWAYLGDNLQ